MTVDEAQDLLRRAMTASVPKQFRPKHDDRRVFGKGNAERSKAIRNSARVEVWALRDAGLTQAQICERLNRSKCFIQRVLKEGREA